MYRFNKVLLISLVFIQIEHTALFAEEFYLDSPYNKSMLRFELDNDTVWDKDSNFTNGWSLQYHTACYDSWKASKAPALVKWMVRHIPPLDDEDAIVRLGHGIGQNMITPGDLLAQVPMEGDLPYAGTLTYSLNLQNFNRVSIRNLQLNAGVLGAEAFAEEFQTFAHSNMESATGPKGWDTQRKTEPILNIGYQQGYRLAHVGNYTNDWGGQLTFGSSVALGNLDTAVELNLAFRFGWNIVEGFGTNPAPSGVGFFQASYLPKPAFASPHSVEMVLGVSVNHLIYSVLYDGSIITSDDRNVEREDFFASGLVGFSYNYHTLLSVRAYFQVSTDLLKKESIPDPPPGSDKTHPDLSYGALIVDFHF